MTGIQRMLKNTSIKIKHLPTIINSQSRALGRRRFQISMVKIALLELKTEVNDDNKLAIITPSIIPKIV
jgi:hypothetical protein